MACIVEKGVLDMPVRAVTASSVFFRSPDMAAGRAKYTQHGIPPHSLPQRGRLSFPLYAMESTVLAYDAGLSPRTLPFLAQTKTRAAIL